MASQEAILKGQEGFKGKTFPELPEPCIYTPVLVDDEIALSLSENPLQKSEEKGAKRQTRCEQISLYNCLKAQRSLLTPDRKRQVRGLTTDLYAQCFEFGFELQDPTRRNFQEEFLRYSFHPDILFDSNKGGHDYFIKQAERYALLYQAQLSDNQITQHDSTGDSFKIESELSISIRHHTIVALYPHMLSDPEFMEKAVGKTLTFKIYIVLHFDENGKIDQFSVEYNMTAGWCRLLQDPLMVNRVVKNQKLTGVFIDDEVEEITQRFSDTSINTVEDGNNQ